MRRLLAIFALTAAASAATITPIVLTGTDSQTTSNPVTASLPTWDVAGPTLELLDAGHGAPSLALDLLSGRLEERAELRAAHAEGERLARERRATVLAEREAAKRAEEARRIEAAKRAEEARKLEEARAAEAARKAEAARAAEAAKKAEEARRAEAARVEAARKAEAARVEAARKAEAARVEAAHRAAHAAEVARKAEAARKAEEARKAEAAHRAAHEAARKPAPRKPAPSSGSAVSGGGGAGGVWAALRQCESGGNYSINTGNGYYGAYQFSPTTWRSLGFSGMPHQASPATQDAAAQKLQARSGWGQWPACSRKLGLR